MMPPVAMVPPAAMALLALPAAMAPRVATALPAGRAPATVQGDPEPPVGPSGLPQRTRSTGPAAVHH